MLTRDQDQLLTFFGFPAEHWIHLRTTNPIESSVSTVKARTKKTKHAGSRKGGLAMTFKLLLAAEKWWRRVNAPHLVALVKAGVEFPDDEAEMLKLDQDTGQAPKSETEARLDDLFTHALRSMSLWLPSTTFDNNSGNRPQGGYARESGPLSPV